MIIKWKLEIINSLFHGILRFIGLITNKHLNSPFQEHRPFSARQVCFGSADLIKIVFHTLHFAPSTRCIYICRILVYSLDFHYTATNWMVDGELAFLCTPSFSKKCIWRALPERIINEVHWESVSMKSWYQRSECCSSCIKFVGLSIFFCPDWYYSLYTVFSPSVFVVLTYIRFWLCSRFWSFVSLFTFSIPLFICFRC